MRAPQPRIAKGAVTGVALLLGVALFSMSRETAGDEPEAGTVAEGWTTDWAAARALAREEDRPLLVVFR